MEKKIEKMGHFLVPSSTSEGVVDALRSLADKLNEIIDHLNSQAQPEENEEWEKRFIRTFGYWGEEIKFIKQLLKEREREVLEEAKKIIDEESIYSGGECGTPLELLEWFVDTGLDKLNKEEK